MQTQLLPFSKSALQVAARLLQEGQVVAIPTETVYGLAADAANEKAVQRIFTAKGRPQDNPLIVHIASLSMLQDVAVQVPKTVYSLAEAFWPGPLTLVLPRAAGIAPSVSAGLSTIGVRMPAHPAALAVIEVAGLPLAAPSANLSGTPSPTSAAHVLADMKGRIPLVLDGGVCDVGIESTVLSLAGKVPVILRPGFVTKEELEEALVRPVALAAAISEPLAEGKRPESPGMKYRHYAPKAAITLVQGDFAAFCRYVQDKAAPGVYALCFAGEEEKLPLPAVVYGRAGDGASQAAGLFAALRALDEQGAQTVYARYEEGEGLVLAVKNRLLRAAAFRVVRL